MRVLFLSVSLFFIVFIQVQAQTTTKHIIIDQFGYLPDAKKIAILKNPQTGFDAGETFEPGANYALVDAESGENVFTGTITAWNGGATDVSSGDKVWFFDFSTVSAKGTYYVLDIDNNKRSFTFEISPAVYHGVLRHAVRTFFYQRVGYEKKIQYAGVAWADGASHTGHLQDKHCRLFSDKNNQATERDVSGGWYDAGDYNKYTNWTANYIVELMKAYLENPNAWSDDYNIPESGNGIPDVLDEAKWGIDHLLRMQLDDGSMLSIVGEDHASPPSAAKGQSLYGRANTSSACNGAAAFAIAAKVYQTIGMTDYADELQTAAVNAWNWAENNPEVLFRNNDAAYNSKGLGAGQQEESEYQRGMSKLEAACFLFDITGNTKYRDYFDNHYQESHFMQWKHAYPFESENQEIMLYYTTIENATEAVVNTIKETYKNTMQNGGQNFVAYNNQSDPYLAYLKDYTWGSNSVKSAKGSMFYNLIHYNIAPGLHEDAYQAALNYVHYIHGVNPLNLVYLSNMYNFGGDNCVNEFYHTWFADGSEKWDRVGESTYGPPPGYLTGGANPSYNWDGCCPEGCGSTENNAKCTAESISPPKGQPAQKSYKDFNTNWPLNSWSVTENSCGYQTKYIRLLSKFVDMQYDCNGEPGGDAYFDACGICSGANTGREPVTNIQDCLTSAPIESLEHNKLLCRLYPNPTQNGVLHIDAKQPITYTITITNINGKIVMQKTAIQSAQIDINSLKSGFYLVIIQTGKQLTKHKLIVLQ